MSRFVLTAQLQLQAPNNVAQVVRQIQSQLNNVQVNVQVQGSQTAQRQIQQLTRQTDNATTAAERMGRAFAISVRRFAAFSIATRAVSLFTSTLSDAVKSAIDFEREMVRVSQVTGDSLAKLKSFSKVVTELSTGFGVASSDILKSGQLILQAGFSAKDTEVALKSLAKAALAPNFDSLSETTEGAIAILAQFGEGVGALEKQLGAINAVAGAFAVEAGDLIDVVRRAGGVFKSSGGDLNELIALFTSVRATTRESAESIGTGLRTIFTRIQRPKTIEYLKQFGVELVDLEGKFVGPFEAVRRLSEALGGLGEGDITFIRIAEELGGFRQIGKVLPLLQQFSVAQAALNTANKAGNSLTQDAATAQQALAIKITKVREEFLALIRSVTETATFQIMANTALTLASALIKVADAIKPLLPLLTALTAIRIAKGLGSFAGSFAGGLSSNRTFSRGGKVHHFARGGMVPGSGNRDTVPAMLQPGEFVVRKSSVNKLGASNLAAMNENKFQGGTTGRGIVGATSKLKSTGKRKDAYGSKEFTPGQGSLQFDVAPGQIGAFVLTPPKGSEGGYTATQPYNFVLPPTNPYAKIAASQAGLTPEDIKAGINASINPATYPVFYPGLTEGRTNLQKNAKYASAVTKGFNDAISAGVNSTIQSVSSQGLLDIPPALNTDENLLKRTIGQIQSDNQVRSSIEGYLFEAMISAFTGASAAGGRANFDFPRSAISQNKDKLATLFGSPEGINKLIKAEAKRSYGEVGGNIQRKLANDIVAGFKGGVTLRTTGSRKQMASGGGVGTDTVPALLTPGEFVVNRQSAQSIGYGALNRMNKVGKYAKGGIVQRFQTGGMADASSRYGAGFIGSGGLDPSQSFIPSNLLTQQAQSLSQLTRATQQTTQATQQTTQSQTVYYTTTQQATQAQQQNTRSLTESISQNKMFAASMATSLIQGFLPAIDENSGALLRMSHGLLGVVSTLTTVGFALEAFGVALNTQAMMQFITGATSLTQTFGGLASKFSNFGKMLGGVTGKFGGITAGLSKALPTFANAGNIIGSAFKGGAQNKSGLFSAVKSGAIGNNPFVNVGGSMGRGATMSSMSGASKFQKFLSQTSGKAGTFFGDLSKGFAAGKTGTGIPTTVSTNPFASMGGSMGQKALTGSVTNTGVATFGKALGTITKGLNAAAGPLLAVQVGLMAASSVVNSFFDYQNKANKAIQEGNAEKASENSVNAAAQESIDSFGSSAIIAGAAIGSLVPGVGTLLGGIIGAGVALTTKFLPSLEKAIFGTDYVNQAFVYLGTAFGGNTYDSIKSLAAAQAQGVKTQKALNDAGERVTQAMQDLENGSISAAQAVAASAAAGAEVSKLTQMNKKAVADNEKNKSGMVGGFLRGTARVGTLGIAGLLGLESGAQRNARIDQENKGLSEQSKKSQEDLITKSTPSINAFSEEIASAGGTFDDVLANLNDSASAAYNPGLYQALIQQGTNPLRKSFENIKKEVERAQKAFDAMNLGMQNVQGTASAAALGITNYASSLQAGNISLTQSIATLEAGVTSAAQGISDADFTAALGDVESTLRKFGANDKQINKFKQNLQAINSVQKNSAKIFAETKNELATNIRKSTSADERKKAFAKTIGTNLAAQGVDPEIIKRIQDAAGNLTDEQLKKIGEGDFSAFESAMNQLGEKTLDQVKGPITAAIKIQEELNNLTKQRIESERKLVEAQQEALDLYLEGREVQASAGGRAVTEGERRGVILGRSNAQGDRLGLTGLRTGSAAELRRRNIEMVAGAAGFQNAARTPGGLSVESGEAQKDLQQAYRQQVDTIRSLIKLEQEELKIIQEKNKLEKDSLESLISGDIDKFFEQQAAVGATAAIATGDERLMQSFGAKALGDAFKNLQAQQQAGVQSAFGMQLGGAGGLLEMGASAALASRGVTDPFAARTLAGTSPEEEARKATIRELGGILGETGQVGVDMARMELNTAEINIAQANIKLQQDINRGNAASQAAGLRRGGMVYASNGIFVPRGTDTVPAMLTPGEFVVNRGAVNRGNNLQILQAMNSGANAAGMNKGGRVSYYNKGGKVNYLAEGGQPVGRSGPMIDPKIVSDLSNALNNFNTQLRDNITSLRNTKFQIKLDTTNVNVNLSGGSFLQGLTQKLKEDLLREVGKEITSYKVGPGGNLQKNNSVLA